MHVIAKFSRLPSLPLFSPGHLLSSTGSSCSSCSTRWCCSTAAAEPAASEIRWIWSASLLFLILKLLNMLLRLLPRPSGFSYCFVVAFFFFLCFNINSSFLGHYAFCCFLTHAVRIEMRNKKKIDIHNKCN